MDLLPKAFASELNNGQIQYNSKVTEIDQSKYPEWWNKKAVTVKIDCVGIKCNDVEDNEIRKSNF